MFLERENEINQVKKMLLYKAEWLGEQVLKLFVIFQKKL